MIWHIDENCFKDWSQFNRTLFGWWTISVIRSLFEIPTCFKKLLAFMQERPFRLEYISKLR